MMQTLPGKQPYNRAYHAFAITLACATFLLLLAGGLVTSNNAGLAVPDWPTSFGSIYKIPPMNGGVLFEHGHRMIAEIVGFLTIILAVWTQRIESRSWMRKLGWAALGLVIFQGILGGTTVLNYLPPPVSAAHATMAQTFFCVAVLMAYFSSRGWLTAEPARDVQPSVINLTAALVCAVYVQLILGAAFRHVWAKFGPNGANRIPAQEIVWTYLVPHIFMAVVVSLVLIATAIAVISKHGHVRALVRPAALLLFLLAFQLSLGFAAYVARVEWGQSSVQPVRFMVAMTVAHLGVGALILATSVILAVSSRRQPAMTGSTVLVHPSNAHHGAATA